MRGCEGHATIYIWRSGDNPMDNLSPAWVPGIKFRLSGLRSRQSLLTCRALPRALPL